tara:strand:+ start:210 stop:392 length:183 start_codon:yes stop_codon:yes gene_type:complete
MELEKINISAKMIPQIIELIHKVEFDVEELYFVYGQEEYTKDYKKVKKQFKRQLKKTFRK